MKRKICLVITTRGNYAKLKSVISHLQSDPGVELQLIVGGGAILPKYGTTANTLISNDIKIDRVIHFLVEGENPITMAKSAGLAITEFGTAFENLRPDAVVVIADRFESLAIAMTSTLMNIPVAHIEGGEVSGSVDESLRHAITKLAHLHFPATKQAAARIEHMGEDTGTIFPVGSTSIDVFKSLNLNDIGPVMEFQRTGGVGKIIDLTKLYIIVIQHPVTTEYEMNLAHINETIEAIDTLQLPTVWIWPNMDAGSDGIAKGIRVFRENRKYTPVHFFKSLPVELFAPLLNNAACIVGNSSSGIREASFLGVPCVNIGSRQNGRERGLNVVDVGNNRDEIHNAIKSQVEYDVFPPSAIYGNGQAGLKIAKILKNFPLKIQKKIKY